MPQHDCQTAKQTVAALFTILLTMLISAPANGQQTDAAASSDSIAVVELFTSQGCSSCPPADRLLAEIDKAGQRLGLPLYTLSMHVDYWNRLGWTDPYSSQQFTQRQRDYAAATGSRQVYTPQMIVNGVTEFVGSDGRKAQAAINEALSRPATAKLTLAAVDAPGGGVRIRYDVTGASPSSEVVVCLVADAEPNEVPRGENAGQRLSHHGVVRALGVARLDRSGRGELSFPRAATTQKLSLEEMDVVAFVQQPRSRQIEGAARTSIGSRVGLR